VSWRLEAFNDYMSNSDNIYLFAGVLVALIGILIVIYNFLRFIVAGKFAKKLLEDKIFFPEQAITLNDAKLGKFTKFLVKKELKINNVGMSKIVFESKDEIKFEDRGEKEGIFPLPLDKQKRNFETDKFYIPELLKYRAEGIYKRAGNSIVANLIVLGVFIGLAFVTIFVLPHFVDLLKSIFQSITGTSFF